MLNIKYPSWRSAFREDLKCSNSTYIAVENKLQENDIKQYVSSLQLIEIVEKIVQSMLEEIRNPKIITLRFIQNNVKAEVS